MKRALFGIALLILITGAAAAQRNEASLTFGALRTADLPGDAFLPSQTSFAFQFDFAFRLVDAKVAALYFDLPLAVAPTTRLDTSAIFFPRSYSSLFFTPGFKVKLAPGRSVSPYGVVGAGIARLNPTDTRVDGRPGSGAEPKTDFAYTFGGGADIRVLPRVSLRGEVRDFRTATPQFNFNLFKETQHNLMVSAGVVLRF